MLGVAVGEQLIAPDDRVLVAKAGALRPDAARVDDDLVVEPRRGPVAAERLEDKRLDALVTERLVAAGVLAEGLHAGDLEPDDIGGVVRDTLRIGVREAHTDREREGVAVHGARAYRGLTHIANVL